MKNRREFLVGCAAVATALSMPLSGAMLSFRSMEKNWRYGLRDFESLLCERIPLFEGGRVVVAKINVLDSDARYEQFTVQLLPGSAMDSGIYHLQTATGPCELYLEAGGSPEGASLTASVSRLRA